jgi:hypothetical protein
MIHSMSAIGCKKKGRLALSLLLVMCLSAAAAHTQWPAGMQAAGTGPKKIHFTPASTDSTGPAFTPGKRIKSSLFNELLDPSMLVQISFRSSRPRSTFLAESNAGVTHRAERTANSIRGPPY